MNGECTRLALDARLRHDSVRHLFIVLLIVPESPRWLAKAGRRNEALAVLTRINGEQTAKEEIKQIETSLQLEKWGHCLSCLNRG